MLVEVNWARHLANESKIKELNPLDSQTEDELTALLQNFDLKDAIEVKNIEISDTTGRHVNHHNFDANDDWKSRLKFDEDYEK